MVIIDQLAQLIALVASGFAVLIVAVAVTVMVMRQISAIIGGINTSTRNMYRDYKTWSWLD